MAATFFLPEAKPTGLVAVMCVCVNKPPEAIGGQMKLSFRFQGQGCFKVKVISRSPQVHLVTCGQVWSIS